MRFRAQACTLFDLSFPSIYHKNIFPSENCSSDYRKSARNSAANKAAIWEQLQRFLKIHSFAVARPSSQANPCISPRLLHSLPFPLLSCKSTWMSSLMSQFVPLYVTATHGNWRESGGHKKRYWTLCGCRNSSCANL